MFSKSLTIPVCSSLASRQLIYAFLKLWCPKLDILLVFYCFGYRRTVRRTELAGDEELIFNPLHYP